MQGGSLVGSGPAQSAPKRESTSRLGPLSYSPGRIWAPFCLLRCVVNARRFRTRNAHHHHHHHHPQLTVAATSATMTVRVRRPAPRPNSVHPSHPPARHDRRRDDGPPPSDRVSDRPHAPYSVHLGRLTRPSAPDGQVVPGLASVFTSTGSVPPCSACIVHGRVLSYRFRTRIVSRNKDGQSLRSQHQPARYHAHAKGFMSLFTSSKLRIMARITPATHPTEDLWISNSKSLEIQEAASTMYILRQE